MVVSGGEDKVREVLENTIRKIDWKVYKENMQVQPKQEHQQQRKAATTSIAIATPTYKNTNTNTNDIITLTR